MDKKQCKKCGNDKELNQFHKDKQKKDGLDLYCKECRNNKSKEYFNNNPLKKVESNIKWRENNQDKVKKHLKIYREGVGKIKLNEWRENNPERVKELNKQSYINHKQRCNELGGYFKNGKFIKKQPKMTLEVKKLLLSLRDRMYSTVKKGYKKQSAKQLLGCTLEEFKQHLEVQFRPEMTWENYGKIWEIDHIEGCCNFDLTKFEEQQKCFHFTNLRPLFSTTKIAESFGYKDIIGNKNRSKYN